MTARIRIAQRLRARVSGELRVYGLKAPATIAWSDGWTLEPEEASDRDLVAGVAAAVHGLYAMDMTRRAWSGRLAEVHGRVPLRGALTTVDHDVFVRLLDFAGRASRLFRATPDPWQALAAGINAWIDGGRWEDDPRWGALQSRPRLFAPADVVLLRIGPQLVDRLPTGAKAPPVAARLALIREHAVLPSPLPGLGVPLPVAPVLHPACDAARLIDEEVLPGGDSHRIRVGDGWVRLSVRRPDVAVRGEDRVRPWLRTGPHGPLVSDLDDERDPPTGPAVALAWERDRPAVEATALTTPPRVRSVRLVPLDEGA